MASLSHQQWPIAPNTSTTKQIAVSALPTGIWRFRLEAGEPPAAACCWNGQKRRLSISRPVETATRLSFSSTPLIIVVVS